MIIYNYKNKYYFSWEDCKKDLPKINYLLNEEQLTDNLLKQLNVIKKEVEEPLPEILLNKLQEHVRKIRNQYLSDTDKYMLRDYPLEQLDFDNIVAYRQYLRDYPKNQFEWWKSRPMSLDEWNSNDFGLYERLL